MLGFIIPAPAEAWKRRCSFPTLLFPLFFFLPPGFKDPQIPRRDFEGSESQKKGGSGELKTGKLQGWNELRICAE